MKRRSLPLLIFVNCVVLCIVFMISVLGSRAVTVYRENTIVPRVTTVVIDPGHGGIDGGAVSCTGILESKLNLDVALRLRDLLNFLGIKTLLIRDTDKSVYTEGNTIGQKKVSDLKNRANIANNTPNAVLVSIHQNYFSDSRYSGAQVFYKNDPDSKALAERLQSHFVSTINPGSKRMAKKADGVYLFDRINCTGVLVECGFLSNYEEEQKLCDPKYQKTICCVLASVFSKYLSDASA